MDGLLWSMKLALARGEFGTAWALFQEARGKLGPSEADLDQALRFRDQPMALHVIESLAREFGVVENLPEKPLIE